MRAPEKLVLTLVAQHARDNGIGWPSVGRLVRRSGLSERTVRTALRALEVAGWLRTELNQGGTSKTRRDQRSNRYRINLDKLHGGQEMPPAADGKSHPSEERGAGDAPRGGQELPVRGAGAAPESVSESVSGITHARALGADAPQARVADLAEQAQQIAQAHKERYRLNDVDKLAAVALAALETIQEHYSGTQNPARVVASSMEQIERDGFHVTTSTLDVQLKRLSHGYRNNAGAYYRDMYDDT